MHLSTETTDPSRITALNEQPWNCLQDMLKTRAELDSTGDMLFYSLGSISSAPKRVSYSMLYDEARECSLRLTSLERFHEGTPILLHLDDHWDTILWLWAILLARAIPVLSSPLSNVDDHRDKHLRGLSELLESPICITKATSLHLFESSSHTLGLHTVESLLRTQGEKSDFHANSFISQNGGSNGVVHGLDGSSEPPAILMLTSGSTGNAKAVRLTHKQIFAAVSGKASVRPLNLDGAFLNWIGLDHVASLVEIHIQALWLGVSQVHVHAADIVASPELFLDLLSRHRVARSFAPNFFLAKLVATCGSGTTVPGRWNLSNLTVLASGGEANDVQTCIAASELLMRHGAMRNVITTGFGMTETCAGAIFNLNCPDYDIAKGRTIASLGRCMRGIEMRVTDTETAEPATPSSPGYLELRGAVVFDGYYRNPSATAEALTSDGWFRTGDQGSIDKEGYLSLTGRLKDVININGVKIVTADVQASLETMLRDTCATRVVCFPSRAPGADTEQITVAYVPKAWPLKPEDIAEVDSLAVQACMMVSTACQPFIFPVGAQSLPKLPISALGKISGVKMRALFEAGVFDKDAEYHRQTLYQFRQRQQRISAESGLSDAETLLRADYAGTKGIDPETIGVDTPIFELGFTSMDIIRLKNRIDTRLGTTVAAIVLIKYYTVRLLAAALDKLNSSSHDTNGTSDADPQIVTETEYDPVVTLRATGSKTPLWLIHPGVGEVLVFVGLAQHMAVDDRPIYALRARGFEPGQVNFSNIAEAVDTYVGAVRRRQPRGPYALAGYSYGTMLAFEMAKKIEAVGEEVRFLGSFNLPPHIKTRMRQLGWNMCLLHLAQFLGLITEEFTENEVVEKDSPYRQASRSEALARVLELADDIRLHDLGLGPQELARWADVAYGLQSMATEYDPSGSVGVIDIFHAEPLKVAAPSREEWVSKQLSKWSDFCRSEPRFHEIGGAHYTMIGEEHVHSFSEKLRAALAARGV
ncbi:acetyl-CoA synthetase-like protein [Hypoxylon sp. NC0597]|nr:acetyl-CoA synthetase-like protein [Hypoxylon sp. NC0597]